jgi:hypothetical protein
MRAALWCAIIAGMERDPRQRGWRPPDHQHQPDEMSDDDMRIALARMSIAADDSLSAADHGERVRRFAAALDRAVVVDPADDGS